MEESLAEKRINRIEDVISRLTEISSDLNKMIAVHEQRLIQNEKQVNNLEEVVEKRREESEIKLRDVYDTIKSEDKNIFEELTKLRNEIFGQHEKLSHKITDIQKVIWIYMGAFTLIAFIISYGAPLIHMLAAANGAIGGGLAH